MANGNWGAFPGGAGYLSQPDIEVAESLGVPNPQRQGYPQRPAPVNGGAGYLSQSDIEVLTENQRREKYLSELAASGRPSWLPSIDEYRTPQEHWASYISGQQPFWSTRAPMADVGSNLMARYTLGAPYMAQAGVPTSFGRFIQDYPGSVRGQAGAAPDYSAFAPRAGGTGFEELRNRAMQAARAATQPTGQYLDPERAGLDLRTPEGLAEWNKRAWYVSQFGPEAEGATANQRAVANLFALQRPGGGMYRGQMANAIRNAMERLQQQRIDIGDPRETFLSWFLGGGGQAGAPTASAGAGGAGTPLRYGMPEDGGGTSSFNGFRRTISDTSTTPFDTSVFQAYEPLSNYNPTSAGEFAAGRQAEGEPPASLVDATSDSYKAILHLLPEPYDAVEAAKRDAGLPYVRLGEGGIRGGVHVPTVEGINDLKRQLQENRQADPRVVAPPTDYHSVDKGGRVIPKGRETDRDKERSRLMKEYIARGMSDAQALKMANETLHWQDVRSGAIQT